MDRLQRLQNWHRFNPNDRESALAVDLSYSVLRSDWDNAYPAPIVGVNYWAAAWGIDTLEEARRQALRDCEPGPFECILIQENGNFVNLDQIVAAYYGEQRQMWDRWQQSLRQAERIDVVSRSFSEFTEQNFSRDSVAPPIEFEIAYPDRFSDYENWCQSRLFYTLRPVQPDQLSHVQSQLSELQGGNLYGRYQRTVSTATNHTEAREGRAMEPMAKFAFVSSGISDRLPENIRTALRDRNVGRVWLEGVVRLSPSGIPLAIEDIMRPLAVETSTGLYTAVEMRLPHPGFNCYVGNPFRNEVIRFTRGSAPAQKASRILGTFLHMIRGGFSESPFSASNVGEDLAPGEVALIRNDLPSRVLGAPYYERSAYFFQSWVAAESSVFYDAYAREDYRGVGSMSIDPVETNSSSHLRVFFRARHMFTRSRHRLGEYREPADSEVTRYGTAIRARIVRAVAQTCRTYSGRVEAGVCIIP